MRVTDALAVPLPKVEAALREVTEVLARELTVPTDAPPPWGEFEWRIARAVASMQGICSQLSARLSWKHPENWRRFLQEQRDHVAGRHHKLVVLLDEINAQAGREGISLVALKGAALHASGIYLAGERPMADIDLLARDADLQSTTRFLEEFGFEVTFTSWRHRVFEKKHNRMPKPGVMGENVDTPIKIEVHTRIQERLPIDEIDITDFVFPDAAHAGINTYPSAAALMMHLLLHASGNMRANALRHIQLHDIARLAGQSRLHDWEELLMARPSGQALWWAVPPLLLTERYYPGTIPAYVTARLKQDCPWLLDQRARRQRLADVSWSNIRVHALPGIEWSRTPREAMRFAISRMWPNRDGRSELRFYAAHHPGADELPWYGISQAARILRWLFSKPPRIQTWIPVRAALAENHADDDATARRECS